jgi:hypothetical protein
MKYNDINFSHIEVSDLNHNKNQSVAYINYREQNTVTKMIMQCDWIRLADNDTPHFRNIFIVAGNEEYIRIPLDLGQVSCGELRTHLKLVDKWASSSEMRKKLFGANMDKYQYVPCNSENRCFEDYNNTTIEYCEMKFNMDTCGQNRINRTMLVKLEDNDKRTIIHAPTTTKIAKEINFSRGIKVFFVHNKIWTGIQSDADSGIMLYGIQIKVKAIEYVPKYEW